MPEPECEFKKFCHEDIGITDDDCADLSGDPDFECGYHRFAVRVQDKLREDLMKAIEREANLTYDCGRNRVLDTIRTHRKEKSQ